MPPYAMTKAEYLINIISTSFVHYFSRARSMCSIKSYQLQSFFVFRTFVRSWLSRPLCLAGVT